MGLKAIYSAADDIPAEVKDFYAESADGRFVLDIEDVDAHPKVRGVITANKENARKAQERQAKIEELEARVGALPEDFDADEWARLKSGSKPDEQVQTLKEQHQRALEAIKAKAKADLDALTSQLGERDQFIDRTTRDQALATALDDAGFDPAHKPMLAKYLADQIKVRREDDGRRVAFAETDLGELAPVDFVKDFAAKQGKAYLAKATGPGAPGSQHTRGGAKTMARADFERLDPASQQRAVVTDGITITD